MKITPVLPYLTPKLRTNNQNKNSNIFSSTNDIFIKTSQNISFKSGLFDDKFYKYKEELEEYILNNEKIDVLKIENIVQKYCPKAKIIELNDTIKQTLRKEVMAFVAFGTKATKKKRKINFEISDKINIYVDIPKECDEKQRQVFLTSLLHESIHALQADSDDRKTTAELYNSYLNKRNQKKVLSDIEKLQKAYDEVKKDSISTYETILKNYLSQYNSNFEFEEKFHKELHKTFDDDFNNLFQEIYNNNPMEILNTTVQTKIQKYKFKNPDLFIDYIKLLTQNEFEAYTKVKEDPINNKILLHLCQNLLQAVEKNKKL